MAEKRDAEQLERFKEAARALGCDDDEAAFDEKLRRIVDRTPTEIQKKPSSRPDKKEKQPT